jgi:hypothetical protein
MDIHHPSTDPTCICGALLGDEDGTLCCKCSARARYQRRRDRARRGHRNPDTRWDGDLA